MDLAAIRKFFRDNPRMWVVLGVAVVATGATAWWVLGGFGVGTSEFFAASGECHWQNPDERGLAECACNGANRQNMCHVCTGSWKEGNTDYSDGQWTAWDDLDLCRPSCPPDSPYETERDIQGGGRFPFPQYCVEKPADCPEGYYAFGNNPTVCAKSTPVPPPATPTPPPVPPGAHSASVLSVQCGATQNVLSWTLPAGHDSNGLIRNLDGANGVFIAPNITLQATTFTDTDVQPGHTYAYRHKAFADKTSNTVTCPPPASPTPIPTFVSTPTPTAVLTPTVTSTPSTPTPTANPSPTPRPSLGLDCEPQSQTVGRNQFATVLVSGGNGTYTWITNGNGIQQSGSSDSVTYSYASFGTKTVTVQSASQFAYCTIVVQAEQTMAPTGPVSVTKQARNISQGQLDPQSTVSVEPNQTVQFVIKVTALQAVQNVIIRDTVPAGMSYKAGSTIVGSVTYTSDDSIVAGGLSVGALTVGQSVTVRWAAVSDRTGTIGVGRQEQRPQVIVNAGGSTIPADMVVSILGTGNGGVVSGPGTVATGPGDAVLIALMTAAALTLLYTAYTRSPSFRRKEVQNLSEQQGPLDFRN